MTVKTLGNNRGAGLVAVLAIVVAISIFALVGSQIVVSQYKPSRVLQSQTTHNLLVRHFANVLKDARAIQNSAASATNPSMGACVNSATCNTSGSQYFNLYDGFGAGHLLVGDGTSHRTFFDIFGNPCTTVSSNCALEAKAFYRAICPAAGICRADFEVSVLEITGLGALKTLIAFNAVSKMKPLGYQFPLVIGAAGSRVPVWSDNFGGLSDSAISQAVPGSDIAIGNAATGSSISFGHSMYVYGDPALPLSHIEGPMVGASNFLVGRPLVSCSGPTCPGVDVYGQIASFGTTWYDRVEIEKNMDVGNNTISSSGVNVGGTLTAAQFFYSSDENLKKNIKQIPRPLEKIEELHPVAFRWKQTGQKDLGFIAQDVEKSFPELVTTREDGTKNLKYGNILPIVLEAYKDSRRITQERLALNETKIHELKLAIEQLQNRSKP